MFGTNWTNADKSEVVFCVKIISLDNWWQGHCDWRQISIKLEMHAAPNAKHILNISLCVVVP